jgi:hypothetical protein
MIDSVLNFQCIEKKNTMGDEKIIALKEINGTATVFVCSKKQNINQPFQYILVKHTDSNL